MSYIDEMNQEKVHVYHQKMKLICYFVIITRSNIIKIASELTRHFINSNSKHLKAANHCIKYLHVIKFLIIRYSNFKSEKLNNQISSSNKKKSNKEMSSTSNSKLNKKTSSIKKNNDKQIFESTTNFLLRMILIEEALKNTFSNCLMIWSIELSKNNSSFRSSSSKRNFSRCCMLTRSWFDEYIFFKSWNLIWIKR
jgi:hypothetical protein